jgi:Protein of unknown function (DUF3617)
MKTSMVVGTALLAGYVAAAVTQSVQPLNASTGLWQMSVTTTWTGLPPQMAGMMENGKTRSYTSCVKPEDLKSNPWQEGSKEKCTWTVLTSTATDMDVKGTGCSMGIEGMTVDVHGKIHLSDSKNGTGSFDISMSGNGQSAQGHAAYTGKWIGSACPAQ